MKRIKTVKIIISLFLGIGILLLFLSAALGGTLLLLHRDDPRVEARITATARNADTLVRYTWNGILYENVPLSAYSSSWHAGDTITLRLSPERPNKPVPQGLDWLAPGVLAFVGADFLLITGVICFVTDPWKLRGRKLRQTGRSVYAYVDSITVNRRIRVNNMCPYVIHCSTRDGQTFQSGNLWEDPSARHPVGSAVLVLVDPQNPKNYLVCEVPRQYGE